jgi:hypothetical protein
MATTSGVNTFSVNRDQIIRGAMLTIGKLEENETPSNQETTDCAMFLNMLVKQWQGTTDFAPGLKTWTRRRGHLFLHSATGQYSLGPGGVGWTTSYISSMTSAAVAPGATVIPLSTYSGMSVGDSLGVEVSSGDLYWTFITALGVGVSQVTVSPAIPAGLTVAASAQVFTYTTVANQPIHIETVMLRDSTYNDTPIRIMQQAEYDQLPTKVNPTNISDPSGVYYEFQLTNGLLYTDVAGAADVTKHLVITFLEAEQDFVNPQDVPEYPQEYFLPLVLGLAKLICPMFNAVWTPLMAENYGIALSIAQKKEPEKIVAYFQCNDNF